MIKQLFIVSSLPRSDDDQEPYNFLDIMPYFNISPTVTIPDVHLSFVHKVPWDLSGEFVAAFDKISPTGKYFQKGEKVVPFELDENEYGMYNVWTRTPDGDVLCFPWEITPVGGIIQADACVCDIGLLMIAGCKCGYLKRDKKEVF